MNKMPKYVLFLISFEPCTNEMAQLENKGSLNFFDSEMMNSYQQTFVFNTL